MTTQKYDIAFKKTLVDLFQSGQSVISLSKEFGVASGTLCKWIFYHVTEPHFLLDDFGPTFGVQYILNQLSRKL